MNFKELYDISLTLRPELAVWPGDPPIEIRQTAQISQGDGVNLTQLSLGAHNGTHIDAPLHFLDRQPGVDELDLQALVGTVHVLDFTELTSHITAQDLAATLPDGAERVLFKTRNSAIWEANSTDFQPDYIALSTEGAEWLVSRGIKLVGIDYLSIEEFEPAEPVTHRTLLAQKIVILEGLDLSRIEPGEYTIFALPLKIKNGDGAPARVLLAR